MKIKNNCTEKVYAALVLAVCFCSGGLTAETVTLTGAGATFPYPLYSKWFDKYHELHPDIEINYQSIGSGGGIRQITARTIDFGASDAPMTDQQLFKIDSKILHIPTVMGAVVAVYNLKNVPDLKLTGGILSGIFMGEIKKWNDPRILKINEGAKLPDSAITVVHRSDGSGTSFCFTDYLSKINSKWSKKAGKGASVNWPIGLGGKGNEGVTGLVKQTDGSIGYVELIYAKHNDLPYALLQNKNGKFVKADVDSVSAAAGEAAKNMPSHFRVSITDSSGDKAYPISTFTWLLVYEKNSGSKGKILKDFLFWMLKDGQTIAPELGYAPLPSNVKTMVEKAVSSIN